MRPCVRVGLPSFSFPFRRCGRRADTDPGAPDGRDRSSFGVISIFFHTLYMPRHHRDVQEYAIKVSLAGMKNSRVNATNRRTIVLTIVLRSRMDLFLLSF